MGQKTLALAKRPYVTLRYLAKAAPSFLVIMALGKFHGVMMPATPIGCLMNIICLELLTAGTTYLLGPYTNVEITYEKQSQTIRSEVPALLNHSRLR